MTLFNILSFDEKKLIAENQTQKEVDTFLADKEASLYLLEVGKPITKRIWIEKETKFSPITANNEDVTYYVMAEINGRLSCLAASSTEERAMEYYTTSLKNYTVQKKETIHSTTFS